MKGKEELMVNRLIKSGVRLPWKTKNKIQYATEVRALKNRADVVYFERNGDDVRFIAAVEAKVQNWRRALQQASRDKLFADRTYVALDERYAAPAIAQIDQFRNAAVGLITVAEHGTTVHFHPPLNTYISERHVETVKQFLVSL